MGIRQLRQRFVAILRNYYRIVQGFDKTGIIFHRIIKMPQKLQETPITKLYWIGPIFRSNFLFQGNLYQGK